MLLAALACSPSVEVFEVPLYTDLTRLVEDGGLARRRIAVEVAAINGESRSAIALRQPRRLELGPFRPGDECRLLFGLALAPRSWRMGRQVEVRISLARGSEEQLLFAEALEGGRKEPPSAWLDREVEIGEAGSATPYSLIFESRPQDGRGSNATILWGSPVIRCPGSLELLAKPPRPNVILISVDTLRRDLLGVYGNSEATTPNLDAFAAESLVFDNAFSTASYTLPSHASMFTGLFPHEHRAGHDNLRSPLPEEVPTVAQWLRDAGYATVGLSAGGTVSKEMGMKRGFREWRERRRTSLGSARLAAYDALGRFAPQPLFLFLHTYDVHAPYGLTADLSDLAGGPETDADAADMEWQRVTDTGYHRHHQLERFESPDELAEAYTRGVIAIDRELGELFDYLRVSGLYDRSLIIVTSDHGESLYERGRYFGHGHTLDDREIRIPLIIRPPFHRQPARRADLVQLVDLAPTIVAAVDLELDPEVPPLSGFDLLNPGEPREFTKGETSIAGTSFARNERWKVVSPPAPSWTHRAARIFPEENRFEKGWQVYDLVDDPQESKNLFGVLDSYPPEVRKMTRWLRDVDPAGRRDGAKTEISPQLEEHLRALGYLD